MFTKNAPKDPKAKGNSFYILRDKEVMAMAIPEIGNVHPFFLDCKRLETSAKMEGNITDEKIISNLSDADKFKSMVAGIGVSLEADNRDQVINFAFQMYGKTDKCVSGTTLNLECKPDGMEQIIWFDDVEWGSDDVEVGQLRFEFEEAGRTAMASVKLYLREGYEAPEQEENVKIDLESNEYKEMINKSLVSTANNRRVKEVIEKAKRGENVTIAFIGGSITEGAGAVPSNTKCYAYQTYDQFKNEFAKGDTVTYIRGGIGGTPSEFGMIRFDRDILRDGKVKPDLVVVEFAVNDADDETEGRCYECLIRKILGLSDETAVVLMFAVFADDWNLQDRLSPCGDRYGLPMVSVKDAVVDQFYKKTGEGRVLSKGQYFYDLYHPTNIGHKIMADSLMHLFRVIDKQPKDEVYDWKIIEPVFGTDFTNIHLFDKQSVYQNAKITQGSFDEVDTKLQVTAYDDKLEFIPILPYNWKHSNGNEPYVLKISCRALVLIYKDSEAAEFGCATVKLDGKEIFVANSGLVGWTHCHAKIIFSEEETKEHVVEISMVEGDEDKLFTILGFGVVE